MRMKGIFLIHFLDKILTVRVRVGICKCKFNPILFLEMILKWELWLIKQIVLGKDELTYIYTWELIFLNCASGDDLTTGWYFIWDESI